MASLEDLLREVGRHLRTHRMAASLTQSQVGERAGIGGKYVSEIERGTRDLPLGTLRAIVHDGLDLALDVRLTDSPAGARRPTRITDAHLPRPLEDLARMIAALPAEQRGSVLAIVRAALRLARGA